jgi:hypothetical protein
MKHQSLITTDKVVTFDILQFTIFITDYKSRTYFFCLERKALSHNIDPKKEKDIRFAFLSCHHRCTQGG